MSGSLAGPQRFSANVSGGARPARNPFEVALLIVCLMVGVIGLVLPSPGPSTTLSVVFGPWDLLIYAGFLLSAGGALIGIWWPRGTVQRLQMGLLIERAALWPVAGMAAAYALSAFDQTGVRALVAAGLIGAVAVACVARAQQIKADLRELQTLLPRE